MRSARVHWAPLLTLHYSESLYESDELPKSARDSAALLASKVYYCLGEYDEALSFAIGSGSAFEAEARKADSWEYVETVICRFFARSSIRVLMRGFCPAKAIDRYIATSSEDQSGKDSKADPRLKEIIEGIFRRCIEEGEYRQVGLFILRECVNLMQYMP